MTLQMKSPAVQETVRRLIRILGAQPAHVSRPEAVTTAARLIHDRLKRGGVSVSWHDAVPGSPLVVAGEGPVLLVTYLDDADPYALAHQGRPPAFLDSFVIGPGIIRKAGVVAAIATLLHSGAQRAATVVIETDRHRGSEALLAWLQQADRSFQGAIWEAVDAPIQTPAVIHSAFGHISVRVNVRARHQNTEAFYGGIVPDIGSGLANAISTLVNEDHEVRLPGFYEDVSAPDQESLAVLQNQAGFVDDWLRRVAPGEDRLPAAHLAMGAFVAPSLVVREITVEHTPPYLPASASVTLDVQLVPGQSTRNTLKLLDQHFRERFESVNVDALLVRPPVVGKASLAALREAFDVVLPVTPGLSPAGLIEAFGIPTVGYACVGHSPDSTSGRVSIDHIVDGVRMVRRVVDRITSPPAPAGR